MRIADVDGDGRLDIVVEHADVAKVGVVLQGADGALRPEALYAAGSGGQTPPFQLRGLAIVDLTGDGRPDIVLYDRLLTQRPAAAGAARAPRNLVSRALRPAPAPPTSAR